MERPFSLYAALRVPAGAPPSAVESAYRSLMKRHHPDHAGPGSAARAAEINAAFSVLRDPARRAAYDRSEHARQCAILAHGTHRMVARRRRFARGGAWLAVAIAIGAGIPLTANWYDGGIVPQRSTAFAGASAKATAATAEPAAPDPIERVADFLAEAARRRPAGPAASPPKRPRAAAAQAASAELRRAPAAEARGLMARPLPPQRPARRASEPAEADFLEREGFIY